MAPHRLGQHPAATEIHIPVEERLLHRFAHRLATSKVHHTIDGR